MRKNVWVMSLPAIVLAVMACGGQPSAATQAPPAAGGTAISSAPPANQPAPPATIIKPGDYNQKIKSGGTVRTYMVHVPAGYDGTRALPLVFVLHGLDGNAAGMVKITGMSEKADRENFFAVYPNAALTTDSDPVNAWNTGMRPQSEATVDDVAFVRDLLQRLGGDLFVDSRRVYATGLSNGAAMSHRLGAELPDVLAGVGIVAGSIGIGQPDGTFITIPMPNGPLPVIMIHGKADTHVLYDGGQATERPLLNVKSVADAVAFWTQADGCTGAPVEASNTANLLVTDYRTCAAGSEVLLYTIVNGRHEWPTLQGHTKFSATDAIWEFFSRHARP